MKKKKRGREKKTKKKKREENIREETETIKAGEYMPANVNTHVHSNVYVPLYTPFLCTTFLQNLRSTKPNI